MKKLNYLLLGAAGLLMASCANDDLQAPATGNGLQITVNLCADPGTRADEALPTGMTLNYAVYDSEEALVEEGTTTFTGTSTTFNTNLLSGKDYTLAFFAQVTDYKSAYTFSAGEKSVTANYGEMTDLEALNNGGYDCFYGTYEYPATGVSGNVSVTLYRPVAQINWGTNDLKGKIAETFSSIYTTLQTEAYTQFDLLSGEMSGKDKLTLGPVQAPTTSYPSVGSTTYTYVGMQYLLATTTSEVYDLNLAISNSNGTETGETVDLVVTAAPLQANYRTNIYGSLLTDNVNLNIELGDWGGSILDPQELGDLVTEGLYYNPTTKTYTVQSPAGLEYYAQNIGTKDKGNTGLSGTTIVLDTDLDYTNTSYTPFYLASAKFDGQGHTVKNLKYNAPTTTQENAAFILAGPGTVQNVNFTGANISGTYCASVVVGYAIATHINNVTVENSTVVSTPWLTTNGKYDDGNNVGGIAGYLSAETTASITNCTVKGCNITGYRKVGGITGISNGSCIVSDNQVISISITANQDLGEGKEYVKPYDFMIGEIVGDPSSATLTNNTATKVSITTISSTGQTTATAASQEALQAAAKSEGATIELQPGNYTLPGTPAEGITISGTKDVVIDMLTNPGLNLPTSGYNNVTFKGLTLNGSTTYEYYGVQGKNVTFDDCVFNLTLWGYVDGLTIKNSTFNGGNDAYCIWIYTANNIEISGCTFNCTNKGILFYNETNINPQTATITDCTFTASAPETGKAAIMLNQSGSYYDVTVSGCKETGFPVNSLSDSALWGLKDSPKYKITVDGQTFSSSN